MQQNDLPSQALTIFRTPASKAEAPDELHVLYVAPESCSGNFQAKIKGKLEAYADRLKKSIGSLQDTDARTTFGTLYVQVVTRW